MVDQAYVERIAKRRAICARLMALVLLLTGLHDIAARHDFAQIGEMGRTTGAVWMVMIVLFVLFAGGGITRTHAMRAAVYDESTIEHGRRAFALGFWIALVVCGAAWIASLHTMIAGAEVAHAVVTMSVAIALLRFATLEMRALKDE
jgi:hypothetical protein